ncbi:MAG: TIGR04282 family arsenosugar biosynthesis glycosyltransferase [Mycobacterium sp.]
MSTAACAILVVAKAPVPGQAKTRLAPQFGPDGAADLAAASLLDTLIAVRSTEVRDRIVALTGDLTLAHRADEIASVLDDFTVIPQRGSEFSERLVEAHVDAAALASAPVLQIGMDTPQVSPDVLTEAAALLSEDGIDAVLGPASDGGWWALGLSDPRMASVLGEIAMSEADTGEATLAALRRLGVVVAELPTLTDVDTPEDVVLVAEHLGVDTHFRRASERISLGRPI